MSSDHPANPEDESKPDVGPSGLVAVHSSHGMTETVRRVEAFLAQKGVRLFAQIDHGAAAAEVGLTLRPTVVLLFGDPRVGTLLMQSDRTIGIDLPLKVLVWEDDDGRVWVTYNHPEYLVRRHHIHDRDDIARAMATGLQALARAATA